MTDTKRWPYLYNGTKEDKYMVDQLKKFYGIPFSKRIRKHILEDYNKMLKDGEKSNTK